MKIEPVVVEISISKRPEAAFELFTLRVAEWWPLHTHSLGAYEQETPQSAIMEPHVGGRIIEVSPDGKERLWGSITAWEPGEFLSFTWHVGRPPENATTVSVTFRPSDIGGTQITLVHDNWQALGDEGPEQRDQYASGWADLLNNCFLPFAT